ARSRARRGTHSPPRRRKLPRRGRSTTWSGPVRRSIRTASSARLLDMPSHVFHRDPRIAYPVAVRGEGCYLYDRDGKRYLDASGGAAVSCLGHSDRAVIEAIQRQLGILPFAHTSFFANEPMEALADTLIARAPKSFDRVYFVSGGSEAMGPSLTLARKYSVERGEPQQRHVIARRQSYHGNTLGALAIGGNSWRRKQFEPPPIEATPLSPCY